MRVLVVHNYYQYRGGEGQAFSDECDLLASRGHPLLRYTHHNDEINEMRALDVGRKTLWNGTAKRELRDLLNYHQPDVIHFHNTFPLISPAAYHAVQNGEVPVVQTLHNYRIMCPGGAFFRDGAACEDCSGKRIAWPGIKRACYRNSRPATIASAAMSYGHRALGTWEKYVDLFIAPSEFTRKKYIAAGFPADRIIVKPHFVGTDPGVGTGDGGYVLYVGRLSEEKGLPVLLSAWQHSDDPPLLKIVGDGPLADLTTRATEQLQNIEWLGAQEPDTVKELMKDAMAVVVPSVCYETFGRVVIEAFAVGTPVVASDIGALVELVEHDRTGRLFYPGSAVDLAEQVEWIRDHPDEARAYRKACREEYESKYTAQRNYELLIDAYEQAALGTKVPHP